MFFLQEAIWIIKSRETFSTKAILINYVVPIIIYNKYNNKN